MSRHQRKNEPRTVEQQRPPAPVDREHIESLLDHALADTFPASDPVSTLGPDPSPSQPSPEPRSSPKRT